MIYISTEQVDTDLLRIMHAIVCISGNITDIRIFPLGCKIYGSYFF